MPPAAGFGMGVDRLVDDARPGSPRSASVIAFPLMRPEGGVIDHARRDPSRRMQVTGAPRRS